MAPSLEELRNCGEIGGMRCLLSCLILGLLGMISAPPANAQKRVALVIGNSAYQHTSPLANPTNDARDLSAVLKKHGFEVVEGFDLDKWTFDNKLREFAEALHNAESAVFFYAGHGLQVDGKNYLLPIDAKLTTAAALDFEMVQLDLIHRSMEREATTNILFVDACRNNPLSRNLARAMGTRSVKASVGLAQVEAGVGTLISFSTQPDNVALDGTGRNSPFARALVRHIEASTDDLSGILIAVRNDVMKETQRKQVPWEHSALTGRFYFNPTPQPTASSSVALKPPAAPPRPVPQRAQSFDGLWAVEMTCPEIPSEAKGYDRQFGGQVKDGVFRAEHGEKGMPNWLALEGKIGPDGKVLMNARGLTSGPGYTVGKPKPGTSYSFLVSARFDGARGTGKRIGGRECDLTFVKQ